MNLNNVENPIDACRKICCGLHLCFLFKLFFLFFFLRGLCVFVVSIMFNLEISIGHPFCNALCNALSNVPCVNLCHPLCNRLCTPFSNRHTTPICLPVPWPRKLDLNWSYSF